MDLEKTLYLERNIRDEIMESVKLLKPKIEYTYKTHEYLKFW